MRRRKRPPSARPWLTGQDVQLAIELPLLWLLALTVPERRWKSLCYRLESAKARMRLFDPGPVASAARRTLGTSDPGFDEHAFALASAAGRSEHHMQILRAVSPGGWHAEPLLVGANHLEAALAAGQGAVLWVAHFCFNALAAKKALAAAGHQVWHISRPEHGFSKSTFGIATFNRIRVRAELAHLAGRIIIDRARPMTATLTAQRLLKKNGIVSITAGAWEGQRLAEVELFGGKIELAVGAPGLARLAGAALLPVFTVRGPEDDTLKVIIEPPLPVANDGGTDEVLQAAAQRFGDRLEQYIRRHPVQWRDWKSLKLPA